MPAPTVDQTTKTLTELAASHQESVNKQSALVTERQKIAFRAHTGDADARIRLTKINLELATIGSEIASLDDAISEGKRRLVRAQDAEDRAKRKEQGLECQRRMKDFRKHGRELDRMVTQLVERYQQFESEIRGVTTEFGIGGPNSSLVRVNCKRALNTMLVGTPLELQLIAPTERRNFSELIGDWAASIEGWASKAIGEPVETEEAA